MSFRFTANVLTAAAALLMSPAVVSAHNIGGSGFNSGVTHPIFGLDHLLAMIAVGVISTRFSGRSIWLVPGTFIVFMIFGGFFAVSGISIPYIETGIALSVLVFGILVALKRSFHIAAALFFTAMFAIFHGHAHGSEMPSIANFYLYAGGFVLTTTLLHIIGVAIGYFAKKTYLTDNMLRLAGAGVGIYGLLLSLNLLIL